MTALGAKEGKMNLCLNCLSVGAISVPVGHEQGSQRDPWSKSVQLCEICEHALLEGDFEVLAGRFTVERTVDRPIRRNRVVPLEPEDFLNQEELGEGSYGGYFGAS